MRRFYAAQAVVTGFILLSLSPAVLAALTEMDISSSLSTLREEVDTARATVPIAPSGNASCGGLLFADDPRVREHQINAPRFSCDLLSSCSLYDENTGGCKGYKCEVEECDRCPLPGVAGRPGGWPYWYWQYRPYWYGHWPYWYGGYGYRWYGWPSWYGWQYGWLTKSYYMEDPYWRPLKGEFDYLSPYWYAYGAPRCSKGCKRASSCDSLGKNCTITLCSGRCGKLLDCSSGECTEVMGLAPSPCAPAVRSCNPLGGVEGWFALFNSPWSSREYRCDNTAGCIFDPSSGEYGCGTGKEGAYTAEVQCYSYTSTSAEPWYHPYSNNCRATFEALPETPAGALAVAPRIHPLPPTREENPPWGVVQGSTLTCAGFDAHGEGHDATVLSAASRAAAFDVPSIAAFATSVVTDQWPDPWNVDWMTQVGGEFYIPPRFPDLSTVLTEVRNPPEVRFILPAESLGFPFGTGSTLLSQISPRLAVGGNPSPLMVKISSVPDVLEVASRIIRNLPLLRVEFTPVDLLLPSMEEAELYVLIEDWERWLEWARRAANTNSTIGAALNNGAPSVSDLISGNVSRMRDEYLPLLREVRRYRQNFPAYLDAVLEAVEEANAFYQSWLTENAKRLQDWRDVQQYLPTFAKDLRALHEEAVEYVDTCLRPACVGGSSDSFRSMPGIPVANDTLPWEVFGSDSAVNMVKPPLPFRDRAYLPGAWRVWENAFGRFGYRTPASLVVGTPLSDVTVDFSSLPFGRAFAVPVLRVSLFPLDLPRPPAIPVTEENIPETWEIRKLPKIVLPSLPIHPPALTVPDPFTSLFFIPDPPRPLSTAGTLLMWERARIEKMKNEACFNPSSKSYLMSEWMMNQTLQELGRGYSTDARMKIVPIGEAVSRPVAAYAISKMSAPWCISCALQRPHEVARQTVTIDAQWGDFQRAVLNVADEWNADVRFLSVVPRNDLERVDQTMRWRLVWKDDPFLPSLSSLRESVRGAAATFLRVFPSIS